MYDYGYNYGYGYTNPSSVSGILGGFLAFGAIIALISLAIGVITLISLWKIYKKAGKQGWESIVPIYNIIVLLEIVKLPMWYIALFFVPFANIYAMIKIYIELAHKFGKTTGFGVVTAFFPYVCLPILGFGKGNEFIGGNNIQSNHNMQYNQQNQYQQYNQPPAFSNEQNNINNNQPNGEPPFMFNQNINTNINQIPASQELNNVEPITQNPQSNMFNVAPDANLQPQINSVNEPINNIVTNSADVSNNFVDMNQGSVVQPQTFTYNVSQPEPLSQEPIQETPVIIAPQPEPVTNLQPMNTTAEPVNAIPDIGPTIQPTMPNQGVDNNQNNTTM